MLPMLEKELVGKLHWTTKEKLLDYFAIGQVTPGIVAVNVATFIGYTRSGILGGIVATVGVVFPSLIIITLIAFCLAQFSSIALVRKALLGINCGVAALLTKVVWNFKSVILKNVLTFLIFASTFVSITFFSVNTIFVVACAIVLGLCVHAINNAHRATKIDKNDGKDGGVDA